MWCFLILYSIFTMILTQLFYVVVSKVHYHNMRCNMMEERNNLKSEKESQTQIILTPIAIFVQNKNKTSKYGITKL